MPTQHWDKRWEEAHRKCEEAAAAGAPRALTDLGIAQVLLHTGQIHESKALVERVLQLQDTQDALEAERAEEFSRPEAEPRVYQLKISLRDARPPIWRRVLVDSSEPLGILHYTIQAAMGWEDDHLHHFTVNGGARLLRTNGRVESCPEYGPPIVYHWGIISALSRSACLKPYSTASTSRKNSGSDAALSIARRKSSRSRSTMYRSTASLTAASADCTRLLPASVLSLSTNEAGRATVIFFSRAPSATLIHPHESTVSSYCAWRKDAPAQERMSLYLATPESDLGFHPEPQDDMRREEQSPNRLYAAPRAGIRTPYGRLRAGQAPRRDSRSLPAGCLQQFSALA